ncbi:hypothetical protein [Bradyrhizobium jicamae]|uniref:hypothetical protein n=1 Tax=Bradyrhizobium jicamae TaxID=280332 RepID=UPI0012ECEE7F|nr:hypothetical protein [Bradyrhizobium jicamae]
MPIDREQAASPLQADDIGAHRQQNCDAYSDNDQEEFSHRAALSNGPNAMQQEWFSTTARCEPAFLVTLARKKGPAIEAGLVKSRRDRDQIATP